MESEFRPGSPPKTGLHHRKNAIEDFEVDPNQPPLLDMNSIPTKEEIELRKHRFRQRQLPTICLVAFVQELVVIGKRLEKLNGKYPVTEEQN